jgi:hypothetical protein
MTQPPAFNNSHIWRNHNTTPSEIARICEEHGANETVIKPTERNLVRLGLSVEEERKIAVKIAKYVESMYVLEKSITIAGAIRRAVRLYVTLNGRPRFCVSSEQMIQYYYNKFKHRAKHSLTIDKKQHRIISGGLDDIFIK